MKAVTFSYDDGIFRIRLVGIFKSTDKCTFNLNSGIMTNDTKWVLRKAAFKSTKV